MTMQFGNIKDVMSRSLEVLAPPPEMTVSQWADKHRRLSSEASASPGQWRTDVVEYMREPMDCVGDVAIRRVTVMACSQIAKTEFLLNIIGYCADYDPSPIMVVQPTLDMAGAFSKDRLATMLRDSPTLRDKVKDVRTRDSGNTILQKQFPGGFIAMVGANSPASLASRPIRVVLCDEVDRFPDSAGSEGDPIGLAVKRTVTFWNRILVFVSTPTIKDASRINDEYENGDMRQYWCPCPDCDTHQVLKWESVKWIDRDADTATYCCEHCGSCWTDAQRIIAVRKGHWRAQKEFNGNASFHVTGMMSPFVPVVEGVREFLAATKNPEKLKVWVNTYLGEVWEDAGERLDYTTLMEQREEYASLVPQEVTILTGAVDVQDDRFEVEILGWGDDNETWSIEYKVIYGDPSAPEIWSELRAFLQQTYIHPLFGEIDIRATCIDTGGHYTRNAYTFSTTMQRVFPIKGVGGEGRPTVGRPSRNNIGKVQLFPLGVDALKETVIARLRVKDQGFAGYCHFPDTYDADYFRGLTAEKLIKKKHNGFIKRSYVKVRQRNEPLDLRVYNTAAIEILGVDLNAQRRALIRNAMRVTQNETGTNQGEQYRPERAKRKTGNWAKSWQDD